MTLILGKSQATAQQMATYLLSKNPKPKFSRNITALEFCQIFLDECAKEGVRGDGAFAQSCKETGHFAYGGDVKYTQNNFAGIGATGGVPGCSFSSIEVGVLAQVQHLKTYATKEPLNCTNVDPRRTTWFVNTKGGTAKTFEELGGSWAVPGYNTKKYKSLEEANKAKDSYGYQVVDILDDILKIKVKEENKMGNSSLIDYTRISPNKTAPRNHVIDTITIHCMAGNLSIETCGNVFASKSRMASSNYGIDSDGRIAMYVAEKDRSWCTSNKANDNRAVTIEVANDGGAPDWHVSDKAMDSLIKLVADVCKRNNIKKLVWSTNKNERVNHLNGCNMTVHRDYAAKSCPGNYLYSKHGYIADEVNKLLGVNVTNSLQQSTSASNTYTVQKGDTLSKIGQKTGVAWKKIAELNGIKFPYVLKVGQVLKLSNSTTTTTTTKPSTTTSTQTSLSVPLKITQSKKSIQEFLNRYYGNEIKKVIGSLLVVDGAIGKNSKLALGIAFQVELNKLGADLIVDGKFGSLSATAFDKYVGKLVKGSKSIFVTLWQCVLVGHGINPNGIDGNFGNGCVSATNMLFPKFGLGKDSSVSGSDINKIL